MRFLDLFNRFRRNKEEDIVEPVTPTAPVETINEPQGEYRFGTEHIYDYKLRAELKSIAKMENKTMGEIVGGLVKDYVENYHKIEQKPTDPNSIAKCCWCGKEFTKKHHSEKYCSDECRKEKHQEQCSSYRAKQQKSKNGKKRTYEILPNGLKLRAIYCEEYTDLPWWGGNGHVYYGNGKEFPLSLFQIKHTVNHFEEIPKDDEDNRKTWFKEEYGLELSERFIDNYLWNLFKGSFDHILEAYYQKNYSLQFDEKGTLLTGGK